MLATYDATWSPDRVIGDLTEACRQQIYGGQDLAVWRDGYLLAIVRQVPDRGPTVTAFG
ncbi:hypothetical protein V5E97_09560 [Singulisphaera sp. Ch08]|uniref:Uncharacterized protein n=1 Tax=Singulisphaera sp. Ch08 TaxID=3120278 RepID=A0AAU7CLE2_9BACT